MPTPPVVRSFGRCASLRPIVRRASVWGTLLLALASPALACTVSGDASRDAQTGGVAGAQDSIRPAAPPGEAATSFPAPSRRIADIVAPRWTNEDARDSDGEFERVAKLSKVRAGQRVADIGAGDGYYVTRLAPIVGATGRVFGNDIIDDYLVLLSNRVQREKLANVQVVRGDPHDPRLPAADVDIAYMIHMYHEIEQPFGLLWNLATSMKPGGRLVILDLERPTFAHGTPPALLRCELRAVGYREVTFTRTGDEEYVAIFEAPSASARPTPAAIRTALQSKPCRA